MPAVLAIAGGSRQVRDHIDIPSQVSNNADIERGGAMDISRLPETQYAQSGEFSIAYQVMGDGPVDIILVPGIISHIDFQHELPGYTRFLRRLAKFARV